MLKSVELDQRIDQMITNRYSDGMWEDGFDGLSQDKHSFEKCKGFMLTEKKNEVPFFTEEGQYGVVIQWEEIGKDKVECYNVILQNKDGTDKSLCAIIQKGETYLYGTAFDSTKELESFLDELLVLSKKVKRKNRCLP